MQYFAVPNPALALTVILIEGNPVQITVDDIDFLSKDQIEKYLKENSDQVKRYLKDGLKGGLKDGKVQHQDKKELSI